MNAMNIVRYQSIADVFGYGDFNDPRKIVKNKSSIEFPAQAVNDIRYTYLILSSQQKVIHEGLKFLAKDLLDTQFNTLRVDIDHYNCKCLKDIQHLLSGTDIMALHVKYDSSNSPEPVPHIVEYLAQGLVGSKITALKLAFLGSRVELDCDDLKILGQVLKDTQITSLDLSGNRIEKNALEYLAEGLKHSQVTSLYLDGVNMDSDPDFKNLAQVLKYTQIESLSLRFGVRTTYLNDQIKVEGMKYLSNLEDTKITSLNLSYNAIGDEGMKYLANCLKGNQITSLNLEGNGIRHEGMKYLASCLKDSQITSLNLCYSNLGDNEIKYLASFLEDSKIKSLNLEYNRISDEGIKYLSSCIKTTRITSLNLECNPIRDEGLKYLSSCLKDSQITSLNLCYNKLEDEGIKYLASCLKDTRITSLDLSYNNMKCFVGNSCNEVECSIGLQHLAQGLKGSQITSLNLSHNNMGDEGVKYLSSCLKDTQITSLDLSDNNFADVGMKYLADCLEDTQIIELDLNGNEIGCDAAEYLKKCLRKSKIQFLNLHMKFKEDDMFYKASVTENPSLNIQAFDLSRSHKLGREAGNYINKTYQTTGISNLLIDTHLLSTHLCQDNLQCLAQAFKDIKIFELEILVCNKFCYNNLKVQVFKKSRISKVKMYCLPHSFINPFSSQYAFEFLKEMKVLALDVSVPIFSVNRSMESLVPVLKMNDIMYIDLVNMLIDSEGAMYLAQGLPQSKILYINLCNNNIGTQGAKYLADALPHSQVTEIDLYANMIGYAGYKYLIDIVDKTNIHRLFLGCNNIEEGLEEKIELSPYIVSQNATSGASKMRYLFQKLVSLDPRSNEFEFIVPRKDTYTTFDADDYALLIKALNDNPHFKLQFYYVFYENEKRHDVDVMDKINEFASKIQDKFTTFFDRKLPELVETFPDYNFVNLVKEFEGMKLYKIVEILLLHRVLYYIDENREILHPYIYKMLTKYNMPLYNKQLEPNKKTEIISYYQKHKEVDGVQEIIDLLESESLN